MVDLNKKPSNNRGTPIRRNQLTNFDYKYRKQLPWIQWLDDLHRDYLLKSQIFVLGPDAFLFINSSLLNTIVLMCLYNRILTYLYNWVRPARKLTRGWPHTPQWPGTSGSRRPGRAETWRRPGQWYHPAWSGWCRSAPVNKSKVSYGYVGAKIRILITCFLGALL